MHKPLSVGELARRSGVAVSALHFYETKGLIRSYRTSGNQRRYEADALRRVAIVRMAQEMGISLAEVGEALAGLPAGRVPSKNDWATISRQWHQQLSQKIVMLERLRDELDGCIGCGCLSLERCPIYNSGDRLAEQGPGPRRLMRVEGE